MSRLNLTESAATMIVKMAGGNPGATKCLCELFSEASLIDPHAALGPLNYIAKLDELGIYGTSIYVLYADQCRKSIRSLCVLLRACQLGQIEVATLQRIASDQTRSEKIDLAPLDAFVCDRLPDFQRPPTAEPVSQT